MRLAMEVTSRLKKWFVETGEDGALSQRHCGLVGRFPALHWNGCHGHYQATLRRRRRKLFSTATGGRCRFTCAGTHCGLLLSIVAAFRHMPLFLGCNTLLWVAVQLGIFLPFWAGREVSKWTVTVIMVRKKGNTMRDWC